MSQAQPMFGAVASLLVTLATLLPSGVWPLSPRPPVVAAFEPPRTAWGPGHRGVDLAGRVGQPVHSALAGTVTYAARLAGRGVVVVDHGDLRTTYEPVRASVHVGQHVRAGGLVGSLEWFGSHCAPRACLHWGLIDGQDHYLDPLGLVDCAPQPVRLLPLDGPVEGAPPGCDRRPPTPAEVRALLATLVGALAGMPVAAGRW